MIVEIPIDDIDRSPFNSRIAYSGASVEAMAGSMMRNGQLVTVRLRASPDVKGRYELIYGHRRFLAAKKLGWKTIRAEVVNVDDEEVLRQSLIENFEREGISDYEKARIFATLNTRFNRTYEEIGQSLGISKQHVGSYLAMLRLFDNSDLASNPELGDALYLITEHHARVLSRVNDKKTRVDLTLMAIKQNLSVRDLANMVAHLRSWFPTKASGGDPEDSQLPEADDVNAATDVEKITRVVFEKFKLAQSGDFEGFKKLHLVGAGFSLFDSYPPFERFDDTRAISREEEWIHTKLPKYSWKIDDLKITVLGHTALTTLRVKYFRSKEMVKAKRLVRGTLVFVRRDDSWKILHEHWSKVEKPVKHSKESLEPRLNVVR